MRKRERGRERESAQTWKFGVECFDSPDWRNPTWVKEFWGKAGWSSLFFLFKGCVWRECVCVREQVRERERKREWYVLWNHVNVGKKLWLPLSIRFRLKLNCSQFNFPNVRTLYGKVAANISYFSSSWLSKLLGQSHTARGPQSSWLLELLLFGAKTFRSEVMMLLRWNCCHII